MIMATQWRTQGGAQGAFPPNPNIIQDGDTLIEELVKKYSNRTVITCNTIPL